MKLAVLLFVLAGCARLHVTDALVSRPWPETAPLRALSLAVNAADGYLLGTVERADEDWTYDDPCGLIASLLGRCEGTHTYRLAIRSGTYPKHLWVFVPARDTLVLPVGTHAVFLWRFTYAYRYQDCRAHAAMSVASCPTDRLPAILSRDAVAAPQDSTVVAALFAGKPR